MRVVRGALNRLPLSIRRRRNEIAFLFFRALGSVLRVVPRRAAFAIIVLFNKFDISGKTVLGHAFRPLALQALANDPATRFSSAASKAFPRTEIVVLNAVGAHDEVVEVAKTSGLQVTSPIIAEIAARSLFELGDFRRGRDLLHTVFSPSQLAERPAVAQQKGLLDLIAGDLLESAANLVRAARGMPHVMRAHHNMAARYSSSYSPHALDIAAGSAGRIYDAANFLGQRVTHVGEGQIGPELYEIALLAQDELALTRPVLSPALTQFLYELEIDFEELRILPEEWFTQVGHLGMLDMLFRMKELGWWSGKALLMARGDVIANHALLRLFRRQGPLVVMGLDVDSALAKELAALQRWKGMSFNAFRLPDGRVVPWQDAGALMLQEWERAGRGYPLRDAFDEVFGGAASLNESVADLKRRWGMEPDDWYVCLHLRDPAHYGELPGTGQTHRNAQVGTYYEAIKHVTDQGGWVVKLGGPKSPKLAPMPRVVDYARGKVKSDALDLHLIRHCRYFIGTTSGLTNVAVSFGVPSALVNCITTDAQLWSNRVRFALKWLRRPDGSLVDQRQITSTPWRWRVFSAELLGRYRATLVDSSADEILETVKEVEAMATGTAAAYCATIPEPDKLIADWRQNLAFPYFYGDALPGLYAARKHDGFVKAGPS